MRSARLLMHSPCPILMSSFELHFSERDLAGAAHQEMNETYQFVSQITRDL